jgi:hypothetical protein
MVHNKKTGLGTKVKKIKVDIEKMLRFWGGKDIKVDRCIVDLVPRQLFVWKDWPLWLQTGRCSQVPVIRRWLLRQVTVGSHVDITKMTKYKKKSYFHQIQSILTLLQKNRFFFFFFSSHKRVFKFFSSLFFVSNSSNKWKFLGFLNLKIYNLKIVLKTSGWF